MIQNKENMNAEKVLHDVNEIASAISKATVKLGNTHLTITQWFRLDLTSETMSVPGHRCKFFC